MRPSGLSREKKPTTMQTIPISTHSSMSGNGCQGALGARRCARPSARRARRNLRRGGLRAAAALALVVPAHVRRASDRVSSSGAAQRSDGHRRALHRAPPGHRAGALPRHARARVGGRRRRRRACSRCSCWWSRRCCACRCGGRSRWRGCGSAPRSTTGSTRTSLGIVVAFFGILASLFDHAVAGARLDRLWRMLRRAAGHEQRDGALPRIFGASAVIALVRVRRLVPRARRSRAVAVGPADAAPVRLLPPVRRALAGGGLRGAARAPRRGAPARTVGAAAAGPLRRGLARAAASGDRSTRRRSRCGGR